MGKVYGMAGLGFWVKNLEFKVAILIELRYLKIDF